METRTSGSQARAGETGGLRRPNRAPARPYFHKIRLGGRVIPVATVVAVGVSEQGHRSVLGVDTGPSEDHVFWTSFLRSLIRRGLKGVRLVISDAHGGLRQAIAKVLSGAQWQRCRVHFMRNLLPVVPKGSQDAVAAIVRTIFAQPDHPGAMAQLQEVLRMVRPRFPQAADLLADAADDVLAHFHFPAEHRRRLHSTNPLERLHKEIKRRTNVVGIFLRVLLWDARSRGRRGEDALGVEG